MLGSTEKHRQTSETKWSWGIILKNLRNTLLCMSITWSPTDPRIHRDVAALEPFENLNLKTKIQTELWETCTVTPLARSVLWPWKEQMNKENQCKEGRVGNTSITSCAAMMNTFFRVMYNHSSHVSTWISPFISRQEDATREKALLCGNCNLYSTKIRQSSTSCCYMRLLNHSIFSNSLVWRSHTFTFGFPSWLKAIGLQGERANSWTHLQRIQDLGVNLTKLWDNDTAPSHNALQSGPPRSQLQTQSHPTHSVQSHTHTAACMCRRKVLLCNDEHESHWLKPALETRTGSEGRPAWF